ncbi:MAG: hypothetical protein E7016_06250 [Alphaproteobacteria bacterium]|nr:hypothetical protein [Alphaproteobacteria bacterium]
MRKYFLTCAIALLATGNVNATTGEGQLQISATISRTNTVSCDPLNFGTIYIKNGEYGTVTVTGPDMYTASDSVIKVVGATHGSCSAFNTDLPIENIMIAGDNGNIVTFKDASGNAVADAALTFLPTPPAVEVTGELNIYDTTPSGAYQTTATILIVQ